MSNGKYTAVVLPGLATHPRKGLAWDMMVQIAQAAEDAAKAAQCDSPLYAQAASDCANSLAAMGSILSSDNPDNEDIAKVSLEVYAAANRAMEAVAACKQRHDEVFDDGASW